MGVISPRHKVIWTPTRVWTCLDLAREATLHHLVLLRVREPTQKCWYAACHTPAHFYSVLFHTVLVLSCMAFQYMIERQATFQYVVWCYTWLHHGNAPNIWF